MSLSHANEDCLFYKKEDYYYKEAAGKSMKVSNNGKQIISNNSLSEESLRNLKTDVNRNNPNYKLKQARNYNQSQKIFPVEKHDNYSQYQGNKSQTNNPYYNLDFFENESFPNGVRNENQFYGNFQNLLCDEENSFSFESCSKKPVEKDQFYSKNKNTDNSSLSIEDIDSSNIQNIYSNTTADNCFKGPIRQNKILNYKNENKNGKLDPNNAIKNGKIFSNYDYNFKNVKLNKKKEKQKSTLCPQNSSQDEYFQEINLNSNFSGEREQYSEQENFTIEDECENEELYKSLDKKEKKQNWSKRTGKWTEEEDRILYEMVPLYGAKNWKKIAENIKGRSPIQCLHRWTKILQPGLVKGPWTIEEDRKLLEWVKKEGPVKWTQCSEFIKGRNGKQCRERWFHTLNPKVIKGNWTNEEDFKIFTLYKKIGGKWSKIALNIPGRTENSIKNRFYSTLRRKAVEQLKFQSSNSMGTNNPENFYNNLSKKNNFSNCTSNYSLDELIQFLPMALMEVKIKFMKEMNISPEELSILESKILQVDSARDQKANSDFSKQKSNEEGKKDNGKIPTVNVNLNFNSNMNNYIIGNNISNSSNSNGNLGNNFDQYEIKNNNIETNGNYSLFNNYNNYNYLENNQIYKENNNTVKLDFSNQGNDYKNLDLFTLENNIIEMCDNPSFMYNDNNFNFLDGHVDNIIDNIFLNNNIIMTNDQEKECNICFLNQKPSQIGSLFENKEEKIQDLQSKEILNMANDSISNVITLEPTFGKNTENINISPNIELSGFFKNSNSNDIFQLDENEKDGLQQVANNESNIETSSNLINSNFNEDNSKEKKTKKHVLSSLINQLEDLEKLVKMTKKELMRYNDKNVNGTEDDQANQAILNSVNLSNTIQKLFK